MKPNYFEIQFDFPVTTPPEWASKVDRWYQLDAESFGLAELGHQMSKKEGRPELILLASPQASNNSDFLFASSGAHSAHRFAHTLANVRSSPFCQTLSWQGPILCIQNDPQTLCTALKQARLLSEMKKIWIIGALTSQSHKAYVIEKFSFADSQYFDLNMLDGEAQEWLRLQSKDGF